MPPILPASWFENLADTNLASYLNNSVNARHYRNNSVKRQAGPDCFGLYRNTPVLCRAKTGFARPRQAKTPEKNLNIKLNECMIDLDSHDTIVFCCTNVQRWKIRYWSNSARGLWCHNHLNYLLDSLLYLLKFPREKSRTRLCAVAANQRTMWYEMLKFRALFKSDKPAMVQNQCSWMLRFLVKHIPTVFINC